jgi:hypothetical protein
MARKNTRSVAQYQGYVPVYLDDKEKKAIKANLCSGQDAIARLEKYAEDDYKIGVNYDVERECFNISMFDLSLKRPTGGFILSAKHSELIVAISTLVYLHEKKYPDGWDIERAGKQDDVSW